MSVATTNSLPEKRPPTSIRFARRLAGLAFGAATQILFLWTAFQLFLFLKGPWPHAHAFSAFGDLLLAAFFAWPHSLLLYPPCQKWLKQSIHPMFMGCVHCVVTCVSLLLLFGLWSTSHTMIWELHGSAEFAVNCAFYGSWAALLYSLWLAGMGYQTGLWPWLCWVRGVKPPRREFTVRGAFRIMRHPVYLSFLGLIWFTPHMSLDHAILTGVWTIYIYVGSYLKDKRLLHYVGEPYREYARRVPGFPLIGFGPLGLLR